MWLMLLESCTAERLFSGAQESSRVTYKSINEWATWKICALTSVLSLWTSLFNECLFTIGDGSLLRTEQFFWGVALTSSKL